MVVATNVPRLAAGLVQLQLKCRLLSLSWIKISAGRRFNVINILPHNQKHFVFFAAFVEDCAIVEKNFGYWIMGDVLS